MSIKLYCVNLENFDINKIKLLDHLDAQKNTYRSKKRQKEWVISQWLRYYILSEHLAIEPYELKFDKEKNKRPFLVNNQLYDFNISHSQKYLVMAVTDQGHVGVDIELLNDKRSLLEIAQSFFATTEVNFLKTLDDSQFVYYFYLIWTLKEAHLKCYGQGIANGLKRSIFSIDDQLILPSANAKGFQYLSLKLDDKTILSLCLDDGCLKLDSNSLECFEVKENQTIKPYPFDIIASS